MYRSLKPWANLTVTIRPFVDRNGVGTKSFGADITAVCYAEGAVELITDNKGAQVVSMTQLYFDGDTTISELDNIVFEGREQPIKKISTFYRGGTADLKVVYL